MRAVVALNFLIGLFAEHAFAYPEFIGYGYSTCIACHYSGAGGAGLTDYGRALFASEIAARPPFLKLSDEELANVSNFLGRPSSPFWFKPGIKYRRLTNTINPGSPNSLTRSYTMQADFNLAIFTNEDADKGVIATVSHVPEPTRAAPNQAVSATSEFMAKEYYLRWQLGEDWLYAGFFDKPFGIRHPDHTAVNRSTLSLGQNDQTHGVMWHRSREKSDLFIHVFLGNTHLTGDDRSKGASILHEIETSERFRPGWSVKKEDTATRGTASLAGHARLGFDKGHAFLYELGAVQRRTDGVPAKNGVYQFMELSYLLARGYNLQSILQLDREDFQATTSENYRWGFGLLIFPFQRVEVRLQGVQVKTRNSTSVVNDTWLAQSQLHFSL